MGSMGPQINGFKIMQLMKPFFEIKTDFDIVLQLFRIVNQNHQLPDVDVGSPYYHLLMLMNYCDV